MDSNMNHDWGFNYFHLCTFCGINIPSLQMWLLTEFNDYFSIFLSPIGLGLLSAILGPIALRAIEVSNDGGEGERGNLLLVFL